jgi:hypothetical protein
MSKTRDLANLADLNFDSGTMVVDKVNNRVGIGTSSPTQKLDVRGGRSVFQANSDLYSIQVEGASGAGQYYIGATNEASPSLVFSNVSGTERLRINSGGSVGIGTNSPSDALTVSTSAVNGGVTVSGSTDPQYFLNSSGGNQARFKINDASSMIQTGSWTNIPVGFYTNGTERMRIDGATGNVGIGVTPATRFDVGDANSNTVARVRNLNGGGTNTNATLQLSTSNNYVNLLVNEQYNYSQFQQAGNLVNHYSDVDNHSFRTKAGTERLVLSSTGKLETKGRDYGFFNHATNVTLADDASIVLNPTTLGVGMLMLYDTASGSNVLFRVGYGSCAAISGAGGVSFAAADTDGAVCVFSSAHTLTIKNRLGSSRGFTIAMFCAGNNFAG